MRNILILNMILIIGTVNLINLSSSKAEAAKNLLTIGGIGVAGFFYPTAGNIAQAVNQKREDFGIRILVKTARSSVSTLNAVISGEIDFGTVQLSRIYQSQTELAELKDIPETKPCSVINTHAESITLIASIESGIRTVRDLRGKRVGIGSPGSDLHFNALNILTAVGIDFEADLSVVDDRIEIAFDLLQDNDIDAFFYPVGTLSRAFVDLMSDSKKVRLISITAPGIDALIAANPFYEKAVVPMKLYPCLNDNAEIDALAVKISLITSCRRPNKTVYFLTKETVENIEPFAKRRLTASMMTRKELVEGLQAPVHPGAMKYYNESGMDAMLRP